jgi:putative membrane protein
MTKQMAMETLMALIAGLGLVWNVFAQAPQLNAVDKAFVDAAASNGLAEVQLVKLAAGRASHAAVREFAARLEAHHTQANLELRKITDSQGIDVTQQMGTYQAAAKRLTELDGAVFDRAYLQHVIQEHEEAIAQFTKEAQEGQNPQLKAFASKMLPKLREHQQRAQQLADGQS